MVLVLVRAVSLLGALSAACSFEPPDVADDSAGLPDGVPDGRPVDVVDPPDGADANPPPDGVIIIPDAPPPDARLPDARVCPTDVPSACTTAVRFTCEGFDACFVLCRATTATYNTARSRCTSWGGDLASLATLEEDQCVRDVLTAELPAGDAWIGYRQPSGGSPGAGWVWLDGSSAGHTGWHPPDQPDDQNGSENAQEDCADMEIGWSWDWNDDDCTGVQAYVCERPL
jgi:hypothetical protein